MLQKYDADHDKAQWKFDLQRDEVERKFMAALWGVELKDNPSKPKSPSTNGRKQAMTQQDLMRNYGKVNG